MAGVTDFFQSDEVARLGINDMVQSSATCGVFQQMGSNAAAWGTGADSPQALKRTQW